MNEASPEIARVERDGIVLSGGTSTEQLTETMERRAPEPTPEAKGTPAAPADGKPPAATPAPDVPLSRGRQRFADLTSERDAARAEAAAAKAEREALARERDELKARAATPPAEPPKPAAAEPPKAVEKFAFPEYVDYATEHPDVSYSQWELERLQAFSDWKDAKSDIDARVAQALEAQRAAHDTRTLVQQTHVKGRESYPDFDTVLKAGPGTKVNLGPSEAQARARVMFIYQHPQSEHLQYAIMKDGDLAQRLAGMDDIAFGLELAKIAPSATPAPARARTPPPAPYTPVNGNSATVATASSELAKKGDFDAYRSKRAQERGVKPRY